MDCVILAAGEGKRMRPLSYTRPKLMLPVSNKPILEWNLINAINAGINRFIFIVGYRKEIISNYFGNGDRWGIKIEYKNQERPLGTADAVGILEKITDDFIVLSGDTIFETKDINKIIEKESCIGTTEVENASNYGTIDKKGNKLIKIHEKIEHPITNLINAGIYHFNQKIFDCIKKTKKSQRGELEITESINIFLETEDIDIIYLENWNDIVYPWDLLDLNEKILNLSESRIDGFLDKNVTINESVSIGKNSKILSGSYIEGPVVIGENCKVGPNCYIRPYTSIGNNCHVGNACDVKNSIIMDFSNVPHQNYVGDSVIGQCCNLGAGTKIANLRLDKKNIKLIHNGKKFHTSRRKLGAIMGDSVQTGINSVIDVGAVIGNNVFVGPAAHISGEIMPYSRIFS